MPCDWETRGLPPDGVLCARAPFCLGPPSGTLCGRAAGGLCPPEGALFGRIFTGEELGGRPLEERLCALGIAWFPSIGVMGDPPLSVAL